MSAPTSILLSQIRPCATQPRTHFDADELGHLAKSIKEVGQQEPIKVRRVDSDPAFSYEIIDGERRFRAMRSLGKKTIMAVVRRPSSDLDQFVQSVAANFCREPHTSMETATMLSRLVKGFIGAPYENSRAEAVRRSAAICGKTENWVYHHLRFLDLSKELQAMVDRKDISHQVAVAIASFKPELQIGLARSILKSDMSTFRALAFLRSRRGESNLDAKARTSTPMRGKNSFESRLSMTLEWLDSLMAMKTSELKAIFLLEAFDKPAAIRDISDAIEDLQAIKTTMQQCHRSAKPNQSASVSLAG